MLRTALDRLYLAAGVVAGICIVLMALLILTQIVARWFGTIIPSTEDFSGFLLAAASFMALAYTLRSGGHIRVSLLITNLHGRRRFLAELITLVIGAALALYTAWWTSFLVIESYQFGEVSSGYIPVPLWIPQLPMAIGLVVLAIAILDELVLLLRGATPRYMQHEGSAVAPRVKE